MRDIREHFDRGSTLVIAITLLLFGIALFEKGFTHDMLLETGVFLISVKLIMMTYKNSKQSASVQAKLDRVLLALEERAPGASPSTADCGSEPASTSAPRQQ